jgi:hypothetical protein
MSKSFKTDAERNAYLSHIMAVVDMSNDTQYVNGILSTNGVAVTDKLHVARLELMFDSLEKLAALNEVA